jgi:hypothetical protein
LGSNNQCAQLINENINKTASGGNIPKPGNIGGIPFGVAT